MQMVRTGSMTAGWEHLAGQGGAEQRLAGGRARCCCKEMDQGVKTCSVVQQVQRQVVPGKRDGQPRREAAGGGCGRESSWLAMVDPG